MALVELHDCNWATSGCERRSFFVCFSYDFKAASKMVWKREEAVDVEGVLDMGEEMVKGNRRRSAYTLAYTWVPVRVGTCCTDVYSTQILLSDFGVPAGRSVQLRL